MHVDETDLELSSKYHSLMKKATTINQCNIDLYKKKLSDKVEINLFLNQKDLLKKITLYKEDKAIVLYDLIKDEYNFSGCKLKLMLLKKGYLVYSIRHLIPSFLTFISALIVFIICFKLLLSFIFLMILALIIALSFLRSIYYFKCFLYNA